jgi:ribonuclease P/MRP protein subunit POP1
MAAQANQASRKRPASSGSYPVQNDRVKRVRTQILPRQIATQSSDAAFADGVVDPEKVVQARKAEIQALEAAIKNSRHGLSTRAHQSLPRELRRRVASHDPKRVPKRLRRRARKELEQDNTPLRKKVKKGNTRLREQVAANLRAVGKAHAKQRINKKIKKTSEKLTVEDEDGMEITVTRDGENFVPVNADATATELAIISRKPKVKQKPTLAKPPVINKKFKKRQLNKTWLPTHMFHTKRVHMTPSKDPLWRFCIPLSPTNKAFRSSHRASTLRGAIAWDMSYMSTVSLYGEEKSIQQLLKALGVGVGNDPDGLWKRRGKKWREGLRAWQGWLYERDGWPTRLLAPTTIIWCARENHIQRPTEPEGTDFSNDEKAVKRKVFIRLHPAGFMQTWEQITRLSKVQKPEIAVEDLRFEIGSIEVIGPSATEALVNILWPFISTAEDSGSMSHPGTVWNALSPLTNPSSLPSNAVVAFDAVDPRLHHPPRRPIMTQKDQEKLLKILAEWPLDNSTIQPSIFSKDACRVATKSFMSGKSISRRRALIKPPEWIIPSQPTDPKVPVLLFASKSGIKNAQGSWTLLMPWIYVLPTWYSLMQYPVATGGTIRFGGLKERKQISFESNQAWYPGDYPGTKAGDEWELRERSKRKQDWDRMPKAKRVNWETLDLGRGRKGEIGLGWACDWERLLGGQESNSAMEMRLKHIHISSPVAATVLKSASDTSTDGSSAGLVTVMITPVGRGVPTTCARLYRLPTQDEDLKKKWLILLHPEGSKDLQHPGVVVHQSLPKDASADVTRSRLAYLLLNQPEVPKAGDVSYPDVPDEVDLIGFVTTGNMNLTEGKPTGIASILLDRVVTNDTNMRHLCIFRESGQRTGRLAWWKLI